MQLRLCSCCRPGRMGSGRPVHQHGIRHHVPQHWSTKRRLRPVEQELEEDLLYLACRHHIHELLAQMAFKVARLRLTRRWARRLQKHNHHWYLSEEMVPLALLDKGVPTETKTCMVHAMKRSPDADGEAPAQLASVSPNAITVCQIWRILPPSDPTCFFFSLSCRWITPS